MWWVWYTVVCVFLQITGGSSGIGKAVAKEALKRGAGVVTILARDKVRSSSTYTVVILHYHAHSTGEANYSQEWTWKAHICKSVSSQSHRNGICVALYCSHGTKGAPFIISVTIRGNVLLSCAENPLYICWREFGVIEGRYSAGAQWISSCGCACQFSRCHTLCKLSGHHIWGLWSVFTEYKYILIYYIWLRG